MKSQEQGVLKNFSTKNTLYWLLLVFLYYFLISALLTYSAITYLEYSPASTLVLVFVESWATFFFKYFFITLALIILPIALFCIKDIRDKRKISVKSVSSWLVFVLLFWSSSIFVSTVVTFGIALSDGISAKSDTGYLSQELVTDPSTINEFFTKKNNCRSVSFDTDDLSLDLFKVFERKYQHKGTFFTENIIPLLENNLDIHYDLSSYPTFIYDEKFYLTNINTDSLKPINNMYARFLLNCKFGNITIPDAVIKTINAEEYNKIGKEEAIKKTAEIDQHIKDIEKSIGVFNSLLKQAKYYRQIYGDYFWKDHIAALNLDIAECKKIKQWFVNLKNAYSSRLDTISFESGNFKIPNNILLKVDSGSNDTPLDFTTTLVHEYLHYLSYNKKSNAGIPSFFEEGLTQIYTIETMSANNINNQQTSYPIQVYILRRMMKKLSLEKLQQAYFQEDEAALSKLIDTAYGKDFYVKHTPVFTKIMYDTDLRVFEDANTILKDMGEGSMPHTILDTYYGEE